MLIELGLTPEALKAGITKYSTDRKPLIFVIA
jgi:hypothetical protein